MGKVKPIVAALHEMLLPFVRNSIYNIIVLMHREYDSHQAKVR